MILVEAFVGLLVFIAFVYSLFHKQIERALYLNKISKSGIIQIDAFTGKQFEDYLHTLFSKLGYSVTLTKTTGDFGADLILYKDGTRIVVQAKRYSKKVGIKAVQEVYAAMSYYKASSAWVVTNNYFTDAAEQLAKVSTVKLVNKDELMRLMISVK